MNRIYFLNRGYAFKGLLAVIQGRYFSVFRDIPNSLKNEKMIIQKSLHPQFGDCMAKQQLIKSNNIAKYSRKVILSCDKIRFYPWIVLDMDLRCGLSFERFCITIKCISIL